MIPSAINAQARASGVKVYFSEDYLEGSVNRYKNRVECKMTEKKGNPTAEEGL